MAHTETAIGVCPDEESLLVFLLDGEASSPPSLAAHVSGCDRCSTELQRVRSRLALADEIPLPVPPAIRERAAAAPAMRLATSQPARSRLASLIRRTQANVWVPMAIAAAALMTFALRVPPPGAPPQVELTRDAEIHQDARITSATALLRQKPEPDAAVLRNLNRGDSVVLFDRAEDWYQVALPDGTKGWIEVAAFE